MVDVGWPVGQDAEIEAVVAEMYRLDPGVGKAVSTRKAYMSYRTQHQQLLANGSIMVDGDRGRLTRNVVFPSPSTVRSRWGGPATGGASGLPPGGTTFGDWESRGVE